jgi:hypothetical protein
VQRARDQGDFHGGRPATATLLGFVSDSYAELYDMLADAAPGRFETTQALASVGVATFALPADHRSTIGVDYQDSGGIWRELEAIDERDRNRYQVVGGTSLAALAYRIVGTNLTLYPTPSSGQTYRHLYVPIPAKIAALSDTVDGISGWEEYVVVDAIIKCVMSEEGDAGMWMARREHLKQRIEELRTARVITQARTVHDANAVDYNYYEPRGYRW